MPRRTPGAVRIGPPPWEPAVRDRYGERMTVDLRVRGAGPHGRLRGGWDTRARGADATLRGVLDGTRVRLRLRAR